MKYGIRIQICIGRNSSGRLTSIRTSPTIGACTFVPRLGCSLERNHYIASKQREVTVFFSTLAREYGSIRFLSSRLYSMCATASNCPRCISRSLAWMLSISAYNRSMYEHTHTPSFRRRRRTNAVQNFRTYRALPVCTHVQSSLLYISNIIN